jgi:hypothetical protein
MTYREMIFWFFVASFIATVMWMIAGWRTINRRMSFDDFEHDERNIERRMREWNNQK